MVKPTALTNPGYREASGLWAFRGRMTQKKLILHRSSGLVALTCWSTEISGETAVRIYRNPLNRFTPVLNCYQSREQYAVNGLFRIQGVVRAAVCEFRGGEFGSA